LLEYEKSKKKELLEMIAKMNQRVENAERGMRTSKSLSDEANKALLEKVREIEKENRTLIKELDQNYLHRMVVEDLLSVVAAKYPDTISVESKKESL
jgi:hypothetical protein